MHLKCPFCNSYINKINNSDNGIKGHKLKAVSSSRKNDRIYITDTHDGSETRKLIVRPTQISGCPIFQRNIIKELIYRFFKSIFVYILHCALFTVYAMNKKCVSVVRWEYPFDGESYVHKNPSI